MTVTPAILNYLILSQLDLTLSLCDRICETVEGLDHDRSGLIAAMIAEEV